MNNTSLDERILLSNSNFIAGKEYWMQNLSGFSIDESSRFLKETPDGKGPQWQRYQMDEPTAEKILSLCRNNELSVLIYAIAAYSILINRYTGAGCIVVAVPPFSGKVAVPGHRENSFLPVVCRVDQALSFKEHLMEVRSMVVGAMKNQHYPVGRVIAEQGLPPVEEIVDCLISGDSCPAEGRTLPFNVRLEIPEGAIFFDIGAPADIAIPPHRLFGHLRQLFDLSSGNPDVQIKEMSIPEESERQLLLQWSEGQGSPEDNKFRLLDHVRKVIGECGDSRAVEYRGRGLSYGEVGEWMGRIGSYLAVGVGLGAGERVVVLLERSEWQVVVLLGLWSRGLVYVPVEESYPEERIRWQIEDSGASVVVVGSRWASLSGTVGVRVIGLAELLGCPEAAEEVVAPAELAAPARSEVAYMIYTSGSTGRPKGVLVSHGNVDHFFGHVYARNRHRGKVVMPWVASCGFDISLFQLLLPVVCGGESVVVDRAGLEDLEQLAGIVAGSTMVDMVPGVYALLLGYIREQGLAGRMGDMKRVFIGGDVIGDGLLRELSEVFGGAEVVVTYGPTEGTIFCTERVYGPGEVGTGDRGSCIGRPLGSSRVYVLGEGGGVQPVGVEGEICLGGEGVSVGYYNREEQTKERYREMSGTLGRVYRTGDRGRWKESGELEFRGRADGQVKIRGHRIEVGEVESALVSLAGVKQAAVVVRSRGEGKGQLAGYVVVEAGWDREAGLCRLRELLPEYMVPGYVEELEALPLSGNGKVDRRGLSERAVGRSGREERGAARSGLEALLVELWSELLGVERVGINDNFFELGGDSIITIRVVSRLKGQGYGLEVRDMFRYQTIGELSGHIREGEGKGEEGEQGLLEGEVGLLPAQAEYLEKWEELKGPGSHFNQSVLLKLDKGVEGKELEGVVRWLEGRHDGLRMVYERSGGDWKQRYGLGGIGVEEEAWEGDREGLEAAIGAWGGRGQRGLSPEEGRMWRVLRLRTPEWEERDRLLVVVHHLVMDVVSWGVLLEELSEGLRRVRAGGEPEGGLKGLSLRQWRKVLEGYVERAEGQLDYWRAAMKGEVGPGVEKGEGEKSYVKDIGSVGMVVGRETTGRLQEVAREVYRCELWEVVLGLVSGEVGKWSGRRRWVVAVEGHGREALEKGVEASGVVGWLASRYPVVVEGGEGKAADWWVKRMKERLRGIPDKGVGYGVLRYIKGETGLGRKGSWPVVFNYLGQVDGMVKEWPWLGLSQEGKGQEVSGEQEVDGLVTVTGIVRGGQLELRWDYSGKHYEEETVRGWSEGLVGSVEQLVEEAGSGGAYGVAYTPSDVGLRGEVSQEELEGFIREQGGSGSIAGLYRLSALQEGMLFHSLYDRSGGGYVEQLSCVVEGVEEGALRRSWGRLLGRHSILRSSFHPESFGVAVQVVHREVELPWEVEDYRGRGEGEVIRAVEDYKRRDLEAGMELGKAPLMRVWLLREGEERYRMVWTHHHLLTDGWSLPVLVSELLEGYEQEWGGAAVGGQQQQEEDRYEDYIRYVEGLDKEKAERYWRAYLEGLKEGSLLPMVKGTVERSKGIGEYGEQRLEVSEELREGIRRYGQGQRVTVNTIMQGVWAYILSRYTGREEVVYGVTVSGRPEELAGMESRVGMYINTLPLYTRVEGGRKIGEWLAELQGQQIGSREHQYTSLSQIQGWLGKGELFDSLLVFENYPMDGVLEGREWRMKLGGVELPAQTNYPLTITVGGLEEWRVVFSYNGTVLEGEYVGRLRGQFEEVLRQVVLGKADRIEELELLVGEEREELLSGFNATKADYPREATIVSLFEEQAAKYPERTAVQFEKEQIDYKTLNERANQLAHYLRSKNIKEESLVPVCMERGPAMVVGMLAILKAGAAYVPIDPDYPADRVRFMLEDTAADILLSNAKGKAGLPMDAGYDIIDMDENAWHAGNDKKENLSTHPAAGHLAYLIYTSGSTGRPKGVMIEHGSVVNFIYGMDKALSLGQTDNFLSITSISFDISVLELFWTLCRGMCVTLHRHSKTLAGFDKYLSDRPVEMDFSIFYFSNNSNNDQDKYDLVRRSVEYADKNGFSAVWLPERHFHEFGGIFPNPAVLGAGLATITENIAIRSGSVVLPLHDTLRVAEEWSIVDNLSNGRVALSIASGWHADDFVLKPENFPNRHRAMFTQIEELKRLWKGEAIRRTNGYGREVDVRVFPRPLQKDLPIWITSTGNPATFKSAGKIGANILTNLLGQNIENLRENIGHYKRSLQENGYDPEKGKVALMIHTYVGTDIEKVKAEVKEPFKTYLKSSVDLIKGLAVSLDMPIDNLNEQDMDDLAEAGFERYWQTAALLGTKESCGIVVEKLSAIGVTELACLIDFGIGDEQIISGLDHLNDLRKMFAIPDGDGQSRDQPVTAMQITPSYLNMLIDDPESRRFLGSLRHIVIGGEKLPDELVARLSKISYAAIYNMYGPTETTIWSTSERVRPDSIVTIGRPIQNTQIYILDDHERICPVGVYGHLYIGGDGLSRGYYRAEDLTRTKFIPKPFVRDKNALMYKTGDLARFLPGGNIEIAGRSDDQVKIRGYRIELGEIERALLDTGLVRQSVVVARDDARGARWLAGYVVPREGYSEAAVLALLRTRLPEYMVPGALVDLPVLPLTANGKIDRKALPRQDVLLNDRQGSYTAPRNRIESSLAKVWQDILENGPVGIDDNFFARGGHSLLAARVISAIRRDLKMELAIKELFKYPTIRALSGLLGSRSEPMQGELPPVVAVDRPERIPLSYGQERLWFIDQLEGSAAYHVPYVYRITGRLNIAALERALSGIADRHEVLRTVFAEQDGQPCQQILDKGGWRLGIIDRQEYRTTGSALTSAIQELVSAPFDLAADHKLRADLLILEDEEYVLVATLHHIASDGWSVPILARELEELYNAILEERVPRLESLPVQYADYAIWQRKYLEGVLLERQLSYWKQQLNDVEPLQLPTDLARPAVQSTRGASVYYEFDRKLSEAIGQLGREEEATLFMVLLAAFKILLFRYSGQRDICVGSAIAGRNQRETEGLIGFFVNTLAFRTRVEGQSSFRDLLRQVKEVTLAGYENQDVPFARVVEAVVRERDLGRSPLFQVMFDLQLAATGDERSEGLRGIRLTRQPFTNATSKFDISFSAAERENGLSFGIEYCCDLFDQSTIGRMVRHYEQLLRSIVLDRDCAIGGLQMMDEQEEWRLKEVFAIGGRLDLPGEKTLVGMLEEQVSRTPHAIAVVCEDSELSYRELDRRSGQLGRYLRKLGVSNGTLVPVCIDRSLEMIVGILGILKAGGAYVPIDPEYPLQRIGYMLEDTAAEVVISSRACRGLLPDGLRVVSLDEEWEEIAREEGQASVTAVDADDLAYVIYTSGSTGRPKGVMIGHRAVVNRLIWAQYHYQLGPEDTILQKTTFCFDVSVWELFWPLLTGAKLVFARPGGHRDNAYLKYVIDERQITVIHFVPSMLDVFLADLTPGECKSLRKLLCSGEALTRTQIEQFTVRLPGTRLYNLYGPTEAAVDVSYWDMPVEGVPEKKSIPIGRPVANTRLYILDKGRRLVHIGGIGELYIAGVQLARGYVNRPELTDERFVPDPFDQKAGARMYRTGDLARWLPDGNIEYLGRADEQVKIRGYRIEPGEIEEVILQSGLASQAIVIAKDDGTGDRKLVGYVVPTGSFEREKLFGFIKSRLPGYMIPTVIAELSHLPLNSNGKLDRKALPAVATALPENDYVPPRNGIEETLVGVWQELLGIEKIGINDNFFELGGHSLLAIKVLSRINREFETSLSIKRIFQFKNIAGLAAYIEVLSSSHQPGKVGEFETFEI